MVAFLVPVYCITIFGLPLSLAYGVFRAAKNHGMEWIAVPFLPVVYALGLVLVAAALSMTGRRAIRSGFFPRDLRHEVYGPRRLYALCWTSIYYFTGLYAALLSIPAARKLLFRLFGYQGSLNFTIYPDVWVRDLPLLNFKDGAYMANRSTIGSNLCLMNGKIFVDGITVGAGSMVGHMSLVAPGVRLEDQVEVGVHTAIGVRTRMQNGSKTGPCVSIHHGVDVGRNVDIGACSYIGLKAKIAAELKIPAGASIPGGADLRTQDDVNQHISSETVVLKHGRMATLKAAFSDYSENEEPIAVNEKS